MLSSPSLICFLLVNRSHAAIDNVTACCSSARLGGVDAAA